MGRTQEVTDADPAWAQMLRYAEELSSLYWTEQDQRLRAERALLELGVTYRATVRALAVALELRDDASGEHAERVAVLALDLAREAAPSLARDPGLEYGFLLHDVGKIGIPDHILLKPGPLTDSESEVMRGHPLLGRRIVAQVAHLGDTARDVVVYHHERWDGAGYPYGLRGDAIPLAARIFALADAFDAITCDRPYRRARPAEEACAEIAAQAGRQFDPAVTEIFLGAPSCAR